MKRVNNIIYNPLFLQELRTIDKFEKNRIYCKHNMSHLLDVCRIAYIKVLESNINVSKDVVYATGLLHDIGRAEQYLTGLDHHIAGKEVITKILQDSCFEPWEIEIIQCAINRHGKRDENNCFNAIFYEADNESRLCMMCEFQTSCKWAVKNSLLGD